MTHPSTVNRRTFLTHAALLPTALSTSSLVSAQATTIAKSSKILVGFAPGGSADLMARALAPLLIGYAPSIVIDNKAGAGGRLALEALKTSEPDGATLLVTPSSMLSIYPSIYKKLSYDPLKDFVPVALLASFSFVLVVGSMVPPSVKTLADFLNWCKANPKQAAYASPGSGSTPHFAGVALAKASHIDLTHVAYRGGALAMNDVLGGQIAANMAVISNALPHIQSGKLRALAVTGNVRNSSLPDISTMVEQGFKEIQATESFVLLAPTKTPAVVIAKLNNLTRDALKAKAMMDTIQKAAFDAASPIAPPEVTKWLAADMIYWNAVVKASGFTPED